MSTGTRGRAGTQPVRTTAEKTTMTIRNMERDRHRFDAALIRRTGSIPEGIVVQVCFKYCRCHCRPQMLADQPPEVRQGPTARGRLGETPLPIT
jgi:hypothetical protein